MRLTQNAGDAVFSGEATPLPGNPDIVVSHGVYSHKGTRTGAGKLANDLRTAQLEALGYSAAICTVSSTNVAQIKILTACGWRCAATLVSKRTCNTIHLFVKDL